MKQQGKQCLLFVIKWWMKGASFWDIFISIMTSCSWGCFFSPNRWQNPCCPWRQPGLHQCQLHPHASRGWGILLHLLPGPAAFHSAGLLADDLGEQIWRHCHDDPGSGKGKDQMSQVLAREAERASGHRQVPDSLREPAVPGVFSHQGHSHSGDRGERFVWNTNPPVKCRMV